MNDLCVLFIYHDVRVSENKLPVNVDMGTLLSPASDCQREIYKAETSMFESGVGSCKMFY